MSNSSGGPNYYSSSQGPHMPQGNHDQMQSQAMNQQHMSLNSANMMPNGQNIQNINYGISSGVNSMQNNSIIQNSMSMAQVSGIQYFLN